MYLIGVWRARSALATRNYRRELACCADDLKRCRWEQRSWRRWCLRAPHIFSKEHEMFALCPEEFGTFHADGGGGGGGMCVGKSQPSAPPAHRDEKEKGGEESYAYLVRLVSLLYFRVDLSNICQIKCVPQLLVPRRSNDVLFYQSCRQSAYVGFNLLKWTKWPTK